MGFSLVELLVCLVVGLLLTGFVLLFILIGVLKLALSLSAGSLLIRVIRGITFGCLYFVVCAY